jgi:hypothetical protein
VFCNKGVSGSTSAELLATFCDNILKKGGSEKLSDEAIEDTLEKVQASLLCVLFCLQTLAHSCWLDLNLLTIHSSGCEITRLHQ